MIEVRNLTKRYGAHTAVDDISFTIEKGTIYGFLGPNGAGKSTTMNILTGCLGATKGEVFIDGHDIMEEPIAAKRLIGYLPEIPPVYTDMTVDEYLRFVASAKGISRKDLPTQLDFVMDKTKITDMRQRLIRNLSKGYRQRVGIAQALLGNPEIIILDEPTVGLDPKQIIEIRDLIRELGQDHTIILSSHILSEVQAVCQHILIISKGKLIVSDRTEKLNELFAGEANICIEACADKNHVASVLETIEGISSTEYLSEAEDATCVRLTPVKGMDIRRDLFNAFSKADLPLLEMRREKASLEDIFLELTESGAEEAITKEDAEAEPEISDEPEQKEDEKA